MQMSLTNDPQEARDSGIDPKTGMQNKYVVLSEEERAKGFVEPVRRTYVHNKCGTATTMGLAIAETYARDPGFYGGTFCTGCGSHFPVAEFTWDGTNMTVGSRSTAQELCRHCGAPPEADGDHSCPCPYSDEDCQLHRTPWRSTDA